MNEAHETINTGNLLIDQLAKSPETVSMTVEEAGALRMGATVFHLHETIFQQSRHLVNLRESNPDPNNPYTEKAQVLQAETDLSALQFRLAGCEAQRAAYNTEHPSSPDPVTAYQLFEQAVARAAGILKENDPPQEVYTSSDYRGLRKHIADNGIPTTSQATT